MKERPSPNHDSRPVNVPVDMLVLHYTGMKSAEEALMRLCDPEAKVSAHYFIARDGGMLRLVEESRRAWHAGVSCWRGQRDVNARSIGIELENPGHEFGYEDFTETQLATLEALCLDILARHPIPARNVVGHSDVAPARKQDPGEKFPWRRMAKQGIGLWPQPPTGDGPTPETSDEAAEKMLHRIGYDTGDLTAAVTAFQRHFRQARVDGRLDKETGAIMRALLRLV